MSKLMKMSKRDYELMLSTLEKKGRDGFDILGDGIIATLGAVSGALSAGAIAGGAGATSIFGITSAASWLGITVVASTPIGWIAGCALAGTAISYGVSKIVKNGAVNTERRKKLREDIHRKISEFQESERKISEEEEFKLAIEILHIAYLQEIISQDKGIVLVNGLKNNEIKPKLAIEIINDTIKKA